MPTALITGISGFVGNHLSNHMLELGWRVYGFDQRARAEQQNTFTGDITDRAAFQAALQSCRPDVLLHLAGLIKASSPQELYSANFLATVNLFESLLASGQRPVVLIASSSAVYGSGFGGRPISEKFRPRPITHYGVSKLAQEVAALRYVDAADLPVMILRMFNLLGPGQSTDLACSAFARQIARQEGCQDGEILTGNLSARRDFVDVRDAVRAFALVAEKGKPGQIYNVCSGRAVSIRQCLNALLSMSRRPFQVRVEASRLQKNDIPVQIGNAGKLMRLTAWRPQISLKQSLADLLAYWRQRVKLEME